MSHWDARGWPRDRQLRRAEFLRRKGRRGDFFLRCAFSLELFFFDLPFSSSLSLMFLSRLFLSLSLYIRLSLCRARSFSVNVTPCLWVASFSLAICLFLDDFDLSHFSLVLAVVASPHSVLMCISFTLSRAVFRICRVRFPCASCAFSSVWVHADN